MDGLILAAGFGSRLREIAASKPLARVNGVSLLELSLRQLASAGVNRAVVVTGYQADAVEAAVTELRERLDVEILTTRVDDWEKPNGYSVVAGASHLPGEYLLVMCDHLLSTPILRGLANSGSPTRDVTLAIDRQVVSPLIDPDDATWVKMHDDGFIESIGKEISQYDAVDCGAFLAGPGLARAILAAIAEGKSGSLSDGMQWLADRGRAATLDIGALEGGQAWWMDVDDPKAHALAEAQLAGSFALLDGRGEVAPA
ncbi:NTP transferase domain-containing protein [Erythrobacter sp. SCSIO 43205]|uniref:phosphocholine cytidylyltransferase family protein n=1 Tax=Erythrobacter sp. SCSIO 43205 TaxID=2779361 RepID=UPI001CA81FE0|nr:NTP transferase domain-containing protein [Erythrobacter sp. SCSIO 43205]UAB77814.1 NTP transferase domain-containing protein [Erythrobacter sp. SCSIO 43205]